MRKLRTHLWQLEQTYRRVLPDSKLMAFFILGHVTGRAKGGYFSLWSPTRVVNVNHEDRPLR
jgi:hypothetical protein